jgi:hypothetical protein
MSVSLTGKDAVVFNERVLADFADGDTVNVDFPNNLAEGKTGKNGNAIFAANASGRNAVVTLRVLRGSPDDKYLTGRVTAYINDPSAYVMDTLAFTKRTGDGSGTVTEDVYSFAGGIPQKIPSTKENVEGDTEQAVAIHTFFFAGGIRAQS